MDLKEMSSMDTGATTWLIIITVVVWISYDFYLYFANKKTISQKITEYANISSGIVFAAGFLCGHWFW